MQEFSLHNALKNLIPEIDRDIQAENNQMSMIDEEQEGFVPKFISGGDVSKILKKGAETLLDSQKPENQAGMMQPVKFYQRPRTAKQLTRQVGPAPRASSVPIRQIPAMKTAINNLMQNTTNRDVYRMFTMYSQSVPIRKRTKVNIAPTTIKT